MALVLGLDPGSRITGYGLVSSEKGRLHCVDAGCIRLAHLEFAQRLGEIHRRLDQLIAAHAPQVLSVEQVFSARNPGSALKLGQARGAAIAVAAVRDLELAEYSARQIKQALTGTGNASKSQVQYMIRALLGLQYTPEEDAADALAAAWCHLATLRELTRRSA